MLILACKEHRPEKEKPMLGQSLFYSLASALGWFSGYYLKLAPVILITLVGTVFAIKLQASKKAGGSSKTTNVLMAWIALFLLPMWAAVALANRVNMPDMSWLGWFIMEYVVR